jgi:hypothetical protein
VLVDRLRLVWITGWFCALSGGLYGWVAEAEPSNLVGLFSFVAPLIAVTLWMRHDAARTRIGAVFDLGFLLSFSWPVAIPWYVWKTRGVSGWKLAVGLLAVIVSWWIGWMCAAWGSYALWYLKS